MWLRTRPHVPTKREPGWRATPPRDLQCIKHGGHLLYSLYSSLLCFIYNIQLNYRVLIAGGQLCNERALARVWVYRTVTVRKAGYSILDFCCEYSCIFYQQGRILNRFSMDVGLLDTIAFRLNLCLLVSLIWHSTEVFTLPLI